MQRFVACYRCGGFAFVIPETDTTCVMCGRDVLWYVKSKSKSNDGYNYIYMKTAREAKYIGTHFILRGQ